MCFLDLDILRTLKSIDYWIEQNSSPEVWFFYMDWPIKALYLSYLLIIRLLDVQVKFDFLYKNSFLFLCIYFLRDLEYKLLPDLDLTGLNSGSLSLMFRFTRNVIENTKHSGDSELYNVGQSSCQFFFWVLKEKF